MAYAVCHHVDEDNDKDNNSRGAYYDVYFKYPISNPGEMQTLFSVVHLEYRTQSLYFTYHIGGPPEELSETINSCC